MKAEPVRDTVRKSIDKVRRGEPDKIDTDEDAAEGVPVGARDDWTEVGLAENDKGVAFQCGTCEYFDDGVCTNENPDLKDREVEEEWCCNLYDHDDMKVIV